MCITRHFCKKFWFFFRIWYLYTGVPPLVRWCSINDLRLLNRKKNVRPIWGYLETYAPPYEAKFQIFPSEKIHGACLNFNKHCTKTSKLLPLSYFKKTIPPKHTPFSKDSKPFLNNVVLLFYVLKPRPAQILSKVGDPHLVTNSEGRHSHELQGYNVTILSHCCSGRALLLQRLPFKQILLYR